MQQDKEIPWGSLYLAAEKQGQEKDRKELLRCFNLVSVSWSSTAEKYRAGSRSAQTDRLECRLLHFKRKQGNFHRQYKGGGDAEVKVNVELRANCVLSAAQQFLADPTGRNVSP